MVIHNRNGCGAFRTWKITFSPGNVDIPFFSGNGCRKKIFIFSILHKNFKSLSVCRPDVSPLAVRLTAPPSATGIPALLKVLPLMHSAATGIFRFRPVFWTGVQSRPCQNAVPLAFCSLFHRKDRAHLHTDPSDRYRVLPP